MVVTIQQALRQLGDLLDAQEEYGYGYGGNALLHLSRLRAAFESLLKDHWSDETL